MSHLYTRHCNLVEYIDGTFYVEMFHIILFTDVLHIIILLF